MEWVERAPAKINLTLDVLYKREDGYHELEMIMSSVDLADHLTFTPLMEDRIEVYTNKAFLPVDKRNHVYQAIKLLKEKYQIPMGIKVDIDKQIPVAAGLGGGSTDAAATLRALNRIWDLQLSIEELIDIGMQIGTDVPYSIVGGTAFVSGSGENVRPIKDIPPCWVILAKPRISVSTRTVFRSLEIEAIDYTPKSKIVENAIEQNDYYEMTSHLSNALEAVTFERYPQLKQLKDRMLRYGLDGATMSGSGPTIIGFSRNYTRVKRVYNSLRGFCEEVYICRTLK
ncbi:4-(cytidine 5'-diphospho)-2-C-methyl-D-erythritol kinase [Jeotgalibaca ciconiae]|uniref:4-diphosphocytidyl-2-C-methyl-D-erythritol kinase n=1 Tax=Jeotgalibaca ciconiae TaxID=2496265 RepID=A0A3Q9BJK0_9LACT|nr:4-(cytidine 5'-diphospho)-2-C-methyl-D-erythritol kinase [Jeotgalibaca ciconiae]AZP03851.1 4-(cytidine 5'-diphospho)-2-C-methyl-D-erythritol kinase [Jeotgalibaca ciconiae]HJB23322.1 4-(cytidine 5'-diphospho)-2-C-methyl-D-erythritol kinase [Candidatus Jeotgalibaca pullicola]